MVRLFGPKRARRVLARHAGWIETVSNRYGVPDAAIKAILYQEMTLMNLLDPLADLAVFAGVLGKKDSSTGYAQIFGYVGLNAANFAVDRGLATYESLGIQADHELKAENQRDVRMVWRLLRRSSHANIELATINLLMCADEMVGRTDFETFSEHELKLVLTRYNANVKRVTHYGEQAYRYYKMFSKT